MILYKGDNFIHIIWRLMVDKRKSLPKCPYWCRRSRRSTPDLFLVDKRKFLPKCPYWCRRSRRSTPDLFFPYLSGPELFVSLPMSGVQTMPVYLTSRSGGNLNNASPFITGYASFADSIAPSDSNLVPSNAGPSHTESDVVEDLLIRSPTQSVFPPQMDWIGCTGPSTSYIAPIQSDPMIPISRNHHSDIQRFYQDFRLPKYSLDTFPGRFFHVVSSTTFVTSTVQTELHHAISRLIVSAFCLLCHHHLHQNS